MEMLKKGKIRIFVISILHFRRKMFSIYIFQISSQNISVFFQERKVTT
ncbi:hypothetical protein CHCC14809_1085 [Bacillus licheniformis]|uniref:Uncharacterized protein n=1 Tax=Bacillus licheniformis TaxID=1402 RepID=A0A8B5YG51_BACLI|nr:hypothetical protein B4091_3657 [Bacillus licheniformis]TWN10453.1 hypothetical protein CHCC14564_3005 [Bacillus licheniformis LMG 17339]OLF99474.1 hypothetical protein B4094_0038 [Bacillus licheniformis]OLG03774.1 hypothetical protein B4124_1694 [Bacillus licheniformis]TWJ48740.1 hypothetical protein CHCC5024_3611 [Bacillus licheniformis]